MKILLTPMLVLMFAFSAFAQEDQMQQGTQDESMQVWMEFMTPGDQHTMLAKGVGEWNVSQKFWMGPGAPPMETEGNATAEMIMGGRYLVTNHSGTVMGMPFEGMSIEGYDNAAEKYVSIWLDNLGTGIAYSEGHYDEAADMIVYEGSMTDPMTKDGSWFKQTVKHMDDGSVYFEMFMKGPDGGEFKSMEITYTKSEM